MPGISRTILDSHTGHPGSLCVPPPPFHLTPLATGSPNVFVNGQPAGRVGDTMACTDPIVAGSPNVFVNDIPVARRGDATGGHTCWPGVVMASGSSNVIAN